MNVLWGKSFSCFVNVIFAQLCLQVAGRSSGTVIPPPLVRGGQHVQSKHNSQIVMPPLVRGAQVSVCHQHLEPRLKGRGWEVAEL